MSLRVLRRRIRRWREPDSFHQAEAQSVYFNVILLRLLDRQSRVAEEIASAKKASQ
jgi:hypothetical protein